MAAPHTFQVVPELASQTLAACLRHWLPGHTWSQVRKLVAGRRVMLNGELWLDDARRLQAGDTVEVLERPVRQQRLLDQINIRHIDAHLIVVEKPAGVATVRHPAELDWGSARRELTPTLDDLVLHQIGQSPYEKASKGRRARLRIVHRLDKETSGLLVFARTVDAERGLGQQFKKHTVVRRYLAVAPGRVPAQTIRSILVPDRGDGRRGSWKPPSAWHPQEQPMTGPMSGIEERHAQAPGPDNTMPSSRRGGDSGKEAITHVRVAEELPGHTLLHCRLETGRTHQIRIHLAELGHPVCGDKVYGAALGLPPPDTSGAPRLALHAAELGFTHPITGESLHWEMPLPPDLREFVDRLRRVGVPPKVASRDR